jgi:hypothetical protein
MLHNQPIKYYPQINGVIVPFWKPEKTIDLIHALGIVHEVLFFQIYQ